jgi:hypothetical protein
MASNPLSGDIPSNGFGPTSIGDIFRPQATGLTHFAPIGRNVSIGNSKARVDKDAFLSRPAGRRSIENSQRYPKAKRGKLAGLGPLLKGLEASRELLCLGSLAARFYFLQ